MVRRSSSRQIEAERRFPIRLRLFIPPGGINQLYEMATWLNQRYGVDGYYFGSCSGPITWREGMFVYLPDAASASELIEQFNLGELVGVAEQPKPLPPPLYRDGEKIEPPPVCARDANK